MTYIPIKNLIDKNNKKYNNKILSRRSIFRILNKFKSANDNLIKIISKKEGKHTCINQDYLYLFYNKKYRLECSKYTELSINFLEGYDRTYYINIANSLSKILSARIIYTVELKDNINHLHLIIENSHINKASIKNYLMNELMHDEARVNKCTVMTSVRDLDKFYHYINKSQDSKIISFEST